MYVIIKLSTHNNVLYPYWFYDTIINQYVKMSRKQDIRRAALNEANPKSHVGQLIEGHDEIFQLSTSAIRYDGGVQGGDQFV